MSSETSWCVLNQASHVRPQFNDELRRRLQLLRSSVRVTLDDSTRLFFDSLCACMQSRNAFNKAWDRLLVGLNGGFWQRHLEWQVFPPPQQCLVLARARDLRASWWDSTRGPCTRDVVRSKSHLVVWCGIVVDERSESCRSAFRSRNQCGTAAPRATVQTIR